MNNDIKEILISHDEIVSRSSELGKIITNDYKDKDLIVIGLLKGSAPFMMELIKSIDNYLEIDFMHVSSYNGTSSGDLQIKKDITVDIKGKDVLIAEDIVDTGKTLYSVVNLFKERGAASVEVVSLLNKQEGRILPFEAKYIGFEVPNKFVVGFGLDYNEKYRNLPYVGVLKEQIYEK